MTDGSAGYPSAYLAETERILKAMAPQIQERLPQMRETLEQARRGGRTIFIMGNGGSASTASHFANDLNKYTIREGDPRFRAVSLADNVATMLAWANDQSYDDIFVEQLKNHLSPGDVLIGISGSGNSRNCLKALAYAREKGATNITWSGFGGGKMPELADQSLVIPSHDMTQCENVHLILEHLLVSWIKGEKSP